MLADVCENLQIEQPKEALDNVPIIASGSIEFHIDVLDAQQGAHFANHPMTHQAVP